MRYSKCFSQLYTIRTCILNLSEENVATKKFKICLEYHIGNCKGPCENRQSEEEYNKEIEQVHHILKGNIAPAKQFFAQKCKIRPLNWLLKKPISIS
jgi:excinuclease ABC subunit C